MIDWAHISVWGAVDLSLLVSSVYLTDPRVESPLDLKLVRMEMHGIKRLGKMRLSPTVYYTGWPGTSLDFQIKNKLSRSLDSLDTESRRKNATDNPILSLNVLPGKSLRLPEDSPQALWYSTPMTLYLQEASLRIESNN